MSITTPKITVNNVDTLKIHSLESFGTYDGPGIRFVIFVQGCPFECVYCANPDTMKYQEGTVKNIESLVQEATHMKPYFSNGGGVTVSGGEPCGQARQLVKLFKRLKEEGLHTCLDTNGYIFNHHVEELLEYTDLVLLDVKHINSAIHKTITGRPNEKVLAFAKHLEEKGKPFWLRYVLVPGLSDDPKHLHELGAHFASYQQLKKLEIQPYHKLGIHKWEHLDKEYPLKDTPENTPEQLAKAKEIFEQYVTEVVIN
ncbi:pyruvate formate-lyase-activating protein [Algivirga pacifica]|uniref:Pyruvate formate-lyase-activating enzyme n=2 Tax=Algivirga pacifica TaxID=1162670 RepID=A0ABP9D6L9_9BACT